MPAQPKPKFNYKNRLQTVRNLYQKPVIRTYGMLVLSLVTVTVLVLTAIRPTAQTISGLIREIKDKRQASLKLSQKIESLTQAQVEYEKIKRQLLPLDAAVPEKPFFAQLVWQLEYLAFSNHLEVNGIQIGKVALLETNQSNGQQPIKISLNFSALGSFDNLKKFSEQLEQLDRIIQISNLNLEKTKTEAGGQMELSLAAEGFYLPGD